MARRVNLQAILFDVDGVLVDSMDMKGDCFVASFKNLTTETHIIRDLHHKHGGLNRQKKIEKMIRSALNTAPTDQLVAEIQENYSRCVKSQMPNVALRPGVVEALQFWQKRVYLFAVSAMPDVELQDLVTYRKLTSFFIETRGFPPTKEHLIKEILKIHVLDPRKCVLIGDSKNDALAARAAGCNFVQIVTLKEISSRQKKSDIFWKKNHVSSISHLSELQQALLPRFHYEDFSSGWLRDR